MLWRGPLRLSRNGEEGRWSLGEELGLEMTREDEIVLHRGLIYVLIIMYKLIYQQGFEC